MLKNFSMLLIVSVVLMSIFFGCAPDEGGSRYLNEPPDTFIVNVPPDSSEVPHDGLVAWNGSDPDGVVVGYFWRLSYESLEGDQVVTDWTFTERPETQVNFYSPEGTRSTTFEVVAVDQFGDGGYNIDFSFPEDLLNPGEVISEPFSDINGNNLWDADLAEPWEDLDGDGEADSGEYTDVNGNNFRDEHISENFLDLGAVDESPAYRTFFTTNQPPDSVQITTQPPEWITEQFPDSTHWDPKYCLEDITRVWNGLTFAWIGSDPDETVFPLYFQWEVQRRSDGEWVRKTKDWISASQDTPFNGNVVLTTEHTYYQSSENYIEYSDGTIDFNPEISYDGVDGFLDTGDYRLIVWVRDASWAQPIDSETGEAIPDTSNFSIIVPDWVYGEARSLLIVDETDHNDNWLKSREFQPLFTEDEIDDFYSRLFENKVSPENIDIFEFSTGGGVGSAPTKVDLVKYKNVLWYNDDSSLQLSKGLDYDGDYAADMQFDKMLVDYMDVGGNLILSGWRLVEAFSRTNGSTSVPAYTNADDEFNYFHIARYDQDTNIYGDFVGAKVESFTPTDLETFSMDLELIENSILFGDSLAIQYVGGYYPAYIFEDPFDFQLYYGFESRTNDTFLDNPDAVTAMAYKTDTFNSALISFPLLLMEQDGDQARILIEKIWDFFEQEYVEP
ncbi:MAG: hypothetical protein B6244_04595 [Candidatus Cloacimonetes bacterium 4572_55]|nr:MAG: hypothetical protein B6244_04595 [Candidatus Cloacimonetes bacterium 4572_55]